MKRTGETTAGASITVGILAAILKLGLTGALVLGLIVGCTMALIVVANRR
ncbi:MAG TPA: hypothetical protein VMZ53_02995 [Kofleriaceae bacterium]|nr:hypothetical protein [Kofleriaceae bacterium]